MFFHVRVSCRQFAFEGMPLSHAHTSGWSSEHVQRGHCRAVEASLLGACCWMLLVACCSLSSISCLLHQNDAGLNGHANEKARYSMFFHVRVSCRQFAFEGMPLSHAHTSGWSSEHVQRGHCRAVEASLLGACCWMLLVAWCSLSSISCLPQQNDAGLNGHANGKARKKMSKSLSRYFEGSQTCVSAPCRHTASEQKAPSVSTVGFACCKGTLLWQRSNSRLFPCSVQPASILGRLPTKAKGSMRMLLRFIRQHGSPDDR